MERSYVLQLQESKFQEFYLAFCGYARCEPLHSFGPAVRPNYILHFVLEGKGTYQIGEQKYRISKGQGFLIEPDISVFYQADREHPWTYLWVGFGGTKAHKFVSDLGLNDERLMFSSRHGQELRRIVYSILKHTEFTVSNSYYLQSKLYEFFSVLTRDLEVESAKEVHSQNIYVRCAIQYIQNYYSSGLQVTDIAKYLNVDRSYLYTLFKENLGVSPKQFLDQFQVSRAKEELMLTNSTIGHIAHVCGFQDTQRFTKVFKAQTGLTPSAYRKESRKESFEKLASGQEELERAFQDFFREDSPDR